MPCAESLRKLERALFQCAQLAQAQGAAHVSQSTHYTHMHTHGQKAVIPLPRAASLSPVDQRAALMCDLYLCDDWRAEAAAAECRFPSPHAYRAHACAAGAVAVLRLTAALDSGGRPPLGRRPRRQPCAHESRAQQSPGAARAVVPTTSKYGARARLAQRRNRTMRTPP